MAAPVYGVLAFKDLLVRSHQIVPSVCDRTHIVDGQKNPLFPGTVVVRQYAIIERNWLLQTLGASKKLPRESGG